MNRFLLGLVFVGIAAVAQAADMHPIVKATPVVDASTSPFYAGLFGGGGWSKVENELTILGTAQGPIKAFPTGFLVGGEFGARWNASPIVIGLNASVAYNFSRGSVACGPDVAAATGNQCLGARKDGLLLQQGAELGINLATLGGYLPSGARPANWPVPITVPASVWGNLTVTGRGGIAERDLTLCATAMDLMGTTTPVCGSKFVVGPYVGARVGAAISQQVEAYVRVDRIFWNSSFTPVQDPRVSGVFANTTRAKDETVAVAGVALHF
jgi:hypothetical protein